MTPITNDELEKFRLNFSRYENRDRAIVKFSGINPVKNLKTLPLNLKRK